MFNPHLEDAGLARAAEAGRLTRPLPSILPAPQVPRELEGTILGAVLAVCQAFPSQPIGRSGLLGLHIQKAHVYFLRGSSQTAPLLHHIEVLQGPQMAWQVVSGAFCPGRGDRPAFRTWLVRPVIRCST